MKKIILISSFFICLFTYGQKSVPTYGAESSTGSSGAAVTVTFPTGHAAGDLVLLVFETAGGQQCPSITSNGFTQLSDSPAQAIVSGVDGTTCSVYWKRCASNAEASFSSGDSGDHQIGRMILIPGANSVGSPFDNTSSGSDGTSDLNISANGVSTKDDNTLVIYFITGNYDGANAKASWSNGSVTSLTEKYDSGTTSGNGGSIAVISGTKATAGATGTLTGTQASNDINAYITVAILPQSYWGAINGVDAANIGTINGIPIDNLSSLNSLNKN